MELISQFKNYLQSQKNQVSPNTLKNYLADIRQFVTWVEKTQGSFNASSLSPEIIEAYLASRKEQSNSNPEISDRSIKRHTSSLRKFASFLFATNQIKFNPFEGNTSGKNSVVKDPWRLQDFRNYLYVFNASPLTIKNYIIDIKQFLEWVAKNEPTEGRESLFTHKGAIFSLLSDEVAQDYKSYLLTSNEFTNLSINRKLSSLRKFFGWARQEGLIKSDVELHNVSKFTKAPVIPLIPTENEASKTNFKSAQELPAVQEVTLTAAPSQKARQKAYSSFPPLRLLQKIQKAAVLGLDATIIAGIGHILDHLHYLAWIASGKQIFSSSAKGFTAQVGDLIPTSQIRRVLQILTEATPLSSSSHAPQAVPALHPQSPLHIKLAHHARHTRPNWYRRYHQLPVAHYIHIGIFILFVTALGFGVYRGLFEDASNNKTLAAPPTAPPRVMSFQGRLTDNNSNPITSAKDLRFAIYNDQSASGAALLWQETQQITPDTDGIFSTLLGSSTSIPSSVFTDNSTLYLGITVQSDPELAPRQQIATVAFAANAETLQGLFPITAVGAGQTNVVLALDSSGDLTIGGSASPTFAATGGEFTISGNVLSLTTTSGSNANINLNPNGLGKIDAQKPIINTTLNNNIQSAAGAVEINDMFAVLATSSGQSAFTLNQDGAGPLISASASGVARFTVSNSGDITAAGDIAVNGGDITSTGDITFNPAGGQLFLADTDTLAIGGHAGAAYNAISNAGGAPTNPNVTADNDLYVQGDLDIGGTLYLNGSQLTPGALVNYWQRNSGAVSPANITDDLLLGATATSSAIIKLPGLTNQNAFFNLGTGNLGVGTTSPVGKFNVNGATTGKALVILNETGGQNIFTASAAGTTRFVIENGGNVGINDSSADQALSVGGSGQFRTTADVGSSARGILVQPGVFNADQYIRAYNNSGFGLQIETSNTGGTGGGNAAIKLGAGGTSSIITFLTSANSAAIERMRLDTSGNLVIGTTSPIGLLNVSGAATGKALAILNETGGQNIFTASASGTTRFVIQNDGNIGIGTSAPGYLFDVQGGSGIVGNFSGRVRGANAVNSDEFATLGQIAGGAGQYWQRAAGTLSPTNITDDVLIGGTANATASALIRLPGLTNQNAFFNLGTGNVGIGSTAPTNLFVAEQTASTTRRSGYFNMTGGTTGTEYVVAQFNVNGTGAQSPALALSSNGTTGLKFTHTGSFTRAFIDNNYSSATTLALGLRGTELLTIKNDGNVGIGSTSPLGLLNVSGASTGKALTILNETGGQNIFTASASGTTRFVIQNNGNVGIGTATPGQALFVNGNIGITGGATNNFIGVSTFNGYNPNDNGGRAGVTAAGSFYVNLDSNNDGTTSIFQVAKDSANLSGGTQLFTVNENGNVGIGTTTNHGFVQVNGGTQGGNAALVVNQTGASTNDIFTASASGTTRFVIANNGSISQTSTATTGNAYALTANSLTSGNALNLSSTSTSLTTGGLLNLDWSPGSATTGTGDLFSLNIGANGSLANLFNIKDNGSSIFSVSETQLTSSLPVNFTSPGDVSIAYDLMFTNPTSSYIKSSAPLYIQAGETYNSSDLVLGTYNTGNVIVDSQAFVTNQAATISGQLVVGTNTAPANIGNFYLTNSSTFGKALAILNQTESSDIFTASTSGTTRFVINANGNVGIGQASPIAPLDVTGDIYLTSGLSTYRTAVSDGTVEATKFCTGDGETNCVTDFSAISGGASIWTDAGTYAYLTNGEVIGNSASAGSNKLAGLYLADSAPAVFGTDNDVTFSFSGTTLAVTQGNNDINFDSNTLFIDGSANNVGIGTTTPNAELTIMGDEAETSTTYEELLEFSVSGGEIGHIYRDYNGSNNYLGIESHNVGNSVKTPLVFQEFGGNVGIGTTIPGQELDVDGDILVAGGGTIDTRASGTLTIGGTNQTGLTLGRTGATTTLNGGSSSIIDFGNFDVAATGNITTAGDLAVNGDDITSDGTLTLDAATDIQLDAAGSDVIFRENGTTFLTFTDNTTDAILTPAGGDLSITGTLDVSGYGAIGDSAAVGTSALTIVSSSNTNNAYGLNVSKTSSVNDVAHYAGAFSLTDTDTTGSSTGVKYGIHASYSKTGSGATTGYEHGAIFASSQVSSGSMSNLINIESRLQVPTGGTVTDATDFYISPDFSDDLGTVTNKRGIRITDWAHTAGAVSNQFGIVVDALTSGTTQDIGVQIGTADTYSLYLTGTGGTANTGINFGVDTNLYRSAANTLRTDDDLVIAGGDLTGANSAAIDIGEATSGDIEITGDLLPASDATYDIGSTTKSWNNGYFTGNLCFDDSDCVSSWAGAGINYWSRTTGVLSPINLNDVIAATTSATTGLTITQTGAFDVVRFEDQASDTTPFVINASGNLGIGTTNASNKLSISDGTYNMLFDGNEIYHTDDNTFYLKSGDGFRLQTDQAGSGFDALSILANGNVGIGTTNPGQELDVNGDILVGANSIIDTRASGTLTIGGTTATTLTLGRSGQTTVFGSTAWTATPTISGLITATSGLTANGALTANNTFTLGDNGDTGSINTSDWDISTTGVLTGISGITTDGGYTQSGSSTNYFSGNVGIGTSTPGNLLDIGSFASSSTVSASLNANSSINTQFKFREQDDTFGASILYEATDNQLQLRTYNGEAQGSAAFTLSRSSGNIAIGTTNTGNFKLKVAGNVGPSVDDTYDLGSSSFRWRDLYLGPASLHIGTDGNEGIIGYDITNNYIQLDSDGNGTPETVFTDAGNIGVGTTNPSTFKLEVAGDIGPTATNSYSLGSSGKQFSNVYAQNFYLDGSPLTPGALINYWQRNAGVVTPTNITDDILLGSTATASALVKIGGTTNATTFFNTGGNLGIGTTNPLGGNVDIYSSTGTILNVRDSSGRNAQLTVNNNWNGGDNAVGISGESGYSLRIRTGLGSDGTALSLLSRGTIRFLAQTGTNNPAERMRIDENGNVGIGSTSPLGKLNVNGAATGKALAILNETGGQNILAASASGTTRFVIQNNGNVGIGTSTPGQELDVNGDILVGANSIIDTRAAGTLTIGGTTATTLTLGRSGQTTVFGSTAWTATPTISGLITATSGLTANGALTANSTFTLGDNGDTGSINTSDWDISTTGALTGISGITTDGGYTQSGVSANTFTGTTTFSGAIDSNGDLSVADTNIAFDGASTTFTTTGAFTLTPGGAVLLGDGGDTMQINSSDWDISTTGALTGISGITTDGGYTQSGSSTNYFSGNVGIGTSNNLAKLTISGGDTSAAFTNPTIALGYSTTGQYANFIHTRHQAGATANNAIDFYTSDGTAAGVFPTNAIHGMSINGGNVGVGSTNPGYKFDVQGGSGIVGNFSGRVRGANAVNSDEFATLAQLTGGTGQYWQRASGTLSPTNITDDVLIGGTANATASALIRLPGQTNQDAFFNLGTGNVAVGTTAPLTKLDVRGSAMFGGFGTATAPLNTSTNASSVEVNIASNSLITLGDQGTGVADPAITLYRTSSGLRTGTAARLVLDSSNFDFRIQQGTNATAYGAETYTDRLTIDSSGGVDITGTFDTIAASAMNIGTATQTALTLGRSGASTTINGSGLTVGPTAWTATPTISGLITATSGLTANGALTANNTFTLGDNGDTGSINTSDWDISTTGVLTGISGITTDGGYTQSGATQNTFTGNIDASSGIDITGANLTVGGANFSVAVANGNITTAGDLAVNGDDITSDGNLTFSATGYVRIGDSGTPTLGSGDDDLYVLGDIEFDGNLYMGASPLSLEETRTMPTVVDDYVEIGNVSILNGAHNIRLSVTVSSSGFSVAKTYLVPINYNQNANTYQTLLPISDTGAYSSNNFAVDVAVNNGVATFRIRRTQGTTAATANVRIESTGLTSDAFTASSTTGSTTAPTGTFGSTAIAGVAGNVGIGTSAPAYKLDVSGGSGIVGQFSGRVIGGSALNSNEFVTLSQLTGGTGQYWQRASGTLSPTNITDDILIGGTANATASALIRLPGQTNQHAFFNLGTGNVGIGSTSPTAKLDVNGGIMTSTTGLCISSCGVQFSRSSNDLLVTVTNAASIRLSTTNIERVRIDASGNVGIGSTSPIGLLNVSGAATGKALTILNETGDQNIFTASDSGTTRFVIQGNGNVGIGTSTPGQELDVNGDILVAGGGTIDTRASGTLTIGGTTATTLTLGRSGQTTVFGSTAWTATPTISGLITATSGLTANGALTANSTFTLGDNGDTGSVNTSDWDISTTGALTGISGITTDGAYTQSGTGINYFSGNVGIGTTAPNRNLAVYSASDVPHFQLASATSGTTTTDGFQIRTISNEAYITNFENTKMYFGNNGSSQQVTIDASGNVGIGSTAPGYQLDVVSGDAIAARFDGRVIGSDAVNSNEFATLGQIAGGAGQYWQRAAGTLSPTNITDDILIGGAANATASALIRFAGTADQDSFINTGGNVGIGTTTTDAVLHVKGRALTNIFKLTNSANNTAFQIDNSTLNAQFFNGDATNPGISSIADTDTGFFWEGGNGRLAITMNATERFSFSAAGNLGIGESSPGSRLAVSGGATIGSSYDTTAAPTNGLLVEGNVGIGTSSPVGLLNVNGAITGKALAVFNETGNQDIFTASASGTTRFVISNGGNVGIGTATPRGTLDLTSTATGSNPSVILGGNAAGDTDFWIARVNDGGNDDDDTLQIGDGVTPGTNPFITLATNGNVGIGTTTTSTGKFSVVGGDVSLGTGVQVDFNDEVGDKLYFWSTSYGMGISSGEANWWSGGTFSFRTSSRTGTEVANLSAVGNLQIDGDLTISGGNVTSATTFDSTLTSTGTLTANGILDANGQLTLGDNGDTGAIDTSDWDISTTGALTGISGITTDGGYTQSGVSANTFTGTTTFSGAIDSNGDLSVADTDIAFDGASTTFTITGDLTLNPGGGDVFLADTDTLSIGGFAGAAYNAISNAGGAPTNPNVTADNDLYVQGDLDIGGTLYVGGSEIANYWSRTTGVLSPSGLNDVIAATTSATTGLTITQTGAFDVARFEDQASDTTPIIINSNGNLGIGTTTAGQELDVNGDILVGANSIIDTRAAGTLTIGGTTATTLTLGRSGQTTVFGSTAWTATPTISGLITATSGLTANGALTANNTFTLGDNGDTGSVNTSDWDISTTGALTGISGITTDGAYTQSGTGINSFTGNIGVGTTAPRGMIAAHRASSGGAPSLSADTNNVALFGTATTPELAIGGYSATPFAMWMQVKRTSNDGTSWPLAIQPLGGNVGIGTSAPGAILDVVGTLSQSSGQVTLGGNVDATSGLDITGANLTVGGSNFSVAAANGNITTAGDLAVNGDDITSDGDLTINAGGGDVFLADTDTLSIGGFAGAAYSALSNAGGSPSNPNVTADNDLYVQGDLDIGGTLYVNGSQINPGSLVNYWQQNSGSLAPATATDKVVLGGNTTTNNQFEVNGKITGKALVALTETGDQNILVASSSASTTVFTLSRTGSLQLAGGQTIDSVTSPVGTAGTLGIGTANQTALTLGRAGAATTINGSATSAIDFGNFDLATTGNITVASGVGIDTNAAGTLAIGNVTATTINMGSTNLARAINIGTGTAIDTINIGTGGTGVDVIRIGASVADLALTDANWSITTAGLITTADDIAVNGGDITSTAGTFNFLDNTTTKTIDIGGVTSSATDTINIATNATANDTIAIGNSHVSTLLTLTGGDDWSISNTGIFTLSASAAQTTGIVITDTDYTNALSVGDNNIIGTTANIDLTNFDVVGSTGNITTAGDLAVNGDDITSDGTLTIDAVTDIQLDAAGSDIILRENGVTFLTITDNTTDATIVPAGGDLALTGNLDISGTLTAGTADAFVVAANGSITTAGDLALNGDDITTDGDLTINPAGGQLFLADTDTLAIGGHAGAAYSAISNAGGSPSNPNVTADNDLYVQGDLDIGGTLYIGGNLVTNYWSKNFGVLSPATTNDVIAATSAATTVFTATQTGAFDVVRFEDQATDTTPFVIDTNGNVGIGTTTTSAAKVTVSGSIHANSFFDLDSTTYFLDPAAVGQSLVTAGNIGIGTTADVSRATINGAVTAGDLTLGYNDASATISTVDTNEALTIDPNGTGAINFHSTASNIDSNGLLTLASDLRLNGNDILDSAGTTRISLGATTTLTNTTLTLSGTTTVTASSLTTLTTAAALAMNGTTTLTLGDNATINGSDTANGNLTLQGTSNATRTTSYLLLQPNGGNVGIGTTAPTQLFHLYGDNTSMIARLQSTGAGASSLTQGAPGLELLANGMNTTSMYTPGIKFGSTDPEFTTTNPKFLAGIFGRATESYTADTLGGMAIDFFTFGNGAGASAVPTHAMTIDHNGRVGIGTTSPDYALHVVGGGHFTTGTRFDSDLEFTDSGATTVQQQNGGSWRINVDPSTGAGTQAFRVWPDGVVQVGDDSTDLSTNIDAGDFYLSDGALCVDNGGDNCDDAARTDGQIYAESTSITAIDLAENYPSKDSSMEAGDIVVIDQSNTEYVKKSEGQYQPSLVGVISTKPGILLGGFGDEMDRFGNDKKYPIALAGRIPTKVSTINGPIKRGDYLTSSPIPGVAMKATRAGQIVAKALEDYTNADPNAVGKIVTFVNVTYSDPEIQIAQSGNLNITGDTSDFKAWVDGQEVKGKAAYMDAAIASVQAGFISVRKIIVTGPAEFLGGIQATIINAGSISVNTLTIAGQSLQDYILSVVENAGLTNGTTSPVANTTTDVISPLSGTDVEIKGDLKITKTASTSGDLSVDGNATIAGTLRAQKIVADEIEGLEARIASIAAEKLTATQAAITNITNITNVYNSSSSAAASQSAQASGSATLSDIVPSLTSDAIETNYLDAASLSAGLAFIPNLNSDFATFNQGLMAFGPSSLNDVSVAGQLAINGSMILAENSINVLGADLEIQPLRQGNIAFMGGLISIDTEGNFSVGGNATFAKNVTVNGKLTAKIISPVPAEDLVIELPGFDDQSTLAVDRPGIVVKNASGSGVLKITDLGDVIASGAGKFGQLASDSLKIVRGAQADTSLTETVASSSAGTATIKAGQLERTIYSKFVTADSLIYITATSDTTGATPFVARQTAEDIELGTDGSFTIRIPSIKATDVKVNWWIIN